MLDIASEEIQVVESLHSAEIVSLDSRRGRNRLTIKDRREATEWIADLAGSRCKLIICANPHEDEEIGDWVSISRNGQPWASWCAARRGSEILLWSGLDGTDLGSFATMRPALDSLIDRIFV